MSRFSAQAIETRRRRAAENLSRVLAPGETVVFHSGSPVQKPGGLDQTYSFLPHPDYQWLTGSRRAHGAVAYSRNEGWTDFVLPITPEELLWEGGGEAPSGRNVAELPAWLSGRKAHLLGQAIQAPAPGSLEVQEALNQARRIKDSEEIALIRSLAGIANAGYRELAQVTRAGATEREMQIAYETAVLKAGADKFPYESIFGAGERAATLHAVPTQRRLEKGDLLLVDAGADIDDYCVDITRIFWADGKPSSQQKMIYDLVLAAQSAGIALCRPGVAWTEVHRASARVIADGLKSLGILQGETDGLLESGAIANFFPHGVGHLVGLRVRDVGGDVTRGPAMTCGIRLRMNLALQAGFVVTVEPGCYFVPAILESRERREKFRTQVNWSEAEKWSRFGGVRLEDDIHIRGDGPENLTAVVEK
jgi:Xaa-Pro dipeptidase